jgi:hypothetical protein
MQLWVGREEDTRAQLFALALREPSSRISDARRVIAERMNEGALWMGERPARYTL